MNPENSPVTGVLEEDSVIVDFGKHAGKTVRQVADLDPDFYQHLATERENGKYSIRRLKDKSFRLLMQPLNPIDH